VVVLIAVIVVAAYGLTVLFTQTVPSTTVKGPNGSPVAVGDCLTLTNSPTTITLSSSSFTQGEINMTCGGGAAFTVTSEGTFTPVFSCAYGYFTNCGTGYSALTVFNFTSWGNQGCSSYGPNGYSITTQGAFITLSKGDYVYCLGYFLGPYSTSSPTSLPSFTITSDSP